MGEPRTRSDKENARLHLPPPDPLEQRLHVRHLLKILHHGRLHRRLVVVPPIEVFELHRKLEHGLLLLVKLRGGGGGV